MSDRMKFIPTLQDRIVADLFKQGCDKVAVRNALKKWNEEEGPLTPFERGCFFVFEEIQDKIRKGEFGNV